MSSTVRSILNPYAIPEELRNHLLDMYVTLSRSCAQECR